MILIVVKVMRLLSIQGETATKAVSRNRRSFYSTRLEAPPQPAHKKNAAQKNSVGSQLFQKLPQFFL